MRRHATSFASGLRCADQAILLEVLGAAIAITDADFGTVQLLDAETGDLKIVAQHGFPQWWVDYWSTVGQGDGVCVTVLEHNARVVVEDVEQSPIFTGTPGLEIQLKAGVRAVQTTPVISRSGRPLGMFSTHYRSRRLHDERTLRLLDCLASQLADIFDRAEAMAALRDSERRYRELVEAVSAVTWSCPPSGLQVEPQPDWMQFTGQSVEEFLGEGWTKVVHPDDLAGALSRWQVAVARTEPYASVHRIRRADGAWRWMSVNAVPVRDDNGTLLGWHGMNIDISERKEAEEKLAEREAEARTHASEIEAIYRSAPIGLCVIDDKLRFRRVNERLAQINGISAADHLGKAIREIVPSLADAVERIARHVLETGEPVLNWEVSGETPSQPGKRQWVEHWVPLRAATGEVVGINVSVEEVTARKVLERRLQQFEVLAETSSQFIGTCDLDQFPLYINEAGLKLIGLESLDTAKKIPILEIVHPDDRVRFRDTFLSRLIRDGRAEGQFRFRHFETGAPIWVLQTANALINQRGEVTAYATVCIDISSRKSAEEALRESEERLRLALSAANMAVWDWNVETGKMLWNDEHYTLLGYVPESITPSYDSWKSRVFPDDLARVEASVQNSLRTGEGYKTVFRVLGKNDELRWVEAHGRVELTPARKSARLYGVLFDVTDRLKREQDLRQRLEEIEALYQNAPLGLALIDQDLSYLRINAALARINGAPAAADVKKTLSEMVPSLAPALEPRIREVLSSGQIVHGETATILSSDRDKRVYREIIYPLLEHDGTVSRVGLIVEDITERRKVEEQNALLLKEVHHRAKNLLAVTQSIAQLTAEDVEPEKFYEAFSSRLRGLAACHDLLVRAEWQGVTLAGLIKCHLRHLEALLDRRIFLKGPEVTLNPGAVTMVGLAVHELATNAIKYGALSSTEGRVTVCWTVSSDASEAEPRFVMTWTEDGGPPVVEPLRKGFGHAVTVDMPEHLLEARVDLSFHPSGVVWKLNAPFSQFGDLLH